MAFIGRNFPKPPKQHAGLQGLDLALQFAGNAVGEPKEATVRAANRVLFAVFVLGVSFSGRAQGAQSDSQTLRDILSELRAMHSDERLVAVSQILLAELQTQQTVVNQAEDRASSARRQLSDLRADEKRGAADLATQEGLRDEAGPADAKNLSAVIEVMKSQLVSEKAREEAFSADLQTDEDKVRSAQEMLDDIRQRLDSAMKKLGPVGDTH